MWGGVCCVGACGGLTSREEEVVLQAQCQHSRQTAFDVSGVHCVCWLCGALGLATGVCVAHTTHTPPVPQP